MLATVGRARLRSDWSLLGWYRRALLAGRALAG
jgi:hypothetical protein